MGRLKPRVGQGSTQPLQEEINTLPDKFFCVFTVVILFVRASQLRAVSDPAMNLPSRFSS